MRLTDIATSPGKRFQLSLFFLAFVAACFFAFHLKAMWSWLMAGVIGAFLYSAPKIPHRSASFLKNIAIGKTIFLAWGWTYATAFLPLLPYDQEATTKAVLFAVNRFFLIYAICILFDYRDRQQDAAAGIRTLVTHYKERSINILFAGSLTAFGLTLLSLYGLGVPAFACVVLLLPGLLLIPLYEPAKRSKNYYLYYFVLDGLMMLSGLLLLLKNSLP